MVHIDDNLNLYLFTEDGGKVLLRSTNLSTLELLQLYNKHITPLAPVEEVSAPIKTKASRTAPRKR